MRIFSKLTLIATLLALCVVVLGAYVRLSDAGLGCPDWPGCYGTLTVPQSESALAHAQTASKVATSVNLLNVLIPIFSYPAQEFLSSRVKSLRNPLGSIFSE